MGTLVLYMKSGNVIKVPNVKNWHVKVSGDDVTYLEIDKAKSLFNRKRGLLLTTLDFSQIEAMEEI